MGHDKRRAKHAVENLIEKTRVYYNTETSWMGYHNSETPGKRVITEANYMGKRKYVVYHENISTGFVRYSLGGSWEKFDKLHEDIVKFSASLAAANIEPILKETEREAFVANSVHEFQQHFVGQGYTNTRKEVVFGSLYQDKDGKWHEVASSKPGQDTDGQENGISTINMDTVRLLIKESNIRGKGIKTISKARMKILEEIAAAQEARLTEPAA